MESLTTSLELPCGDQLSIRPGSTWSESKFFGQKVQTSTDCPAARTLFVKTTSSGQLPSAATQSLAISATELTAGDVLDSEGNVRSCTQIQQTRSDVLCPRGTADGLSTVHFTVDTAAMPYSATKFLTVLQDAASISNIAAGSYDGEIEDRYHPPASMVVDRGQTVHYLMDMTSPSDCRSMSLMCSIPDQFKDDCLMMGSWGTAFEEVKGADFESEDPIPGCTQYTVSLYNDGPGQCGNTQFPIHCWFMPRDDVGSARGVDMVAAEGYTTELCVFGALVHIGACLMMLCCIKTLLRCCRKVCCPPEVAVEAHVETSADYQMMERL